MASRGLLGCASEAHGGLAGRRLAALSAAAAVARIALAPLALRAALALATERPTDVVRVLVAVGLLVGGAVGGDRFLEEVDHIHDRPLAVDLQDGALDLALVADRELEGVVVPLGQRPALQLEPVLGADERALPPLHLDVVHARVNHSGVEDGCGGGQNEVHSP